MYAKLEEMGSRLVSLFVPNVEASACATRYYGKCWQCNYAPCWACCDSGGCEKIWCL